MRDQSIAQKFSRCVSAAKSENVSGISGVERVALQGKARPVLRFDAVLLW